MTADRTAAAAGTRALRAGRGTVVAASGALLLLFAVGLVLWGYRGHDLLPLWVAPDHWSAGDLRSVLADWGTPVSWYTGYFVLLELFPATAGVLAAYFVLRGSLSWFRLYLALVLVLFGTMGGAVPLVVADLVPQLAWVSVLQGLAWVALFPLAYVFPDGRFVPRWSRWLALGWAGLLPSLYIVETAGWDGGRFIEATLLVVLFGSAAAAPIYRYVRVSGPTERLQLRWVMAALVLRFAIAFAAAATPLGRLQDEVSGRGLATYAAVMGVSYAIAALLPVAIAIAIVRHRLFDIDVWINRTLVYGMLTGFVVGTYALVVLGIGALWSGGSGLALPLLATALVAVAFSPVRERVQRGVNRLVYGQRGEPYTVVSQLGRQLESAVPPDAVLQTIVDTIGPALKLRYARATLAGADGRGATFPSPPPEPPPASLASFLLRYHDEELGTLEVAARPGEQLAEADRLLLVEVTRQAGIAVRAATLTADLRRSREGVVAAREEERRRLHRDLHDGLGPTLASLYQRVDAARGMLAGDPAAAERLLADAGDQVRTVIADIRRLVYSLRPPALDELGLVPAVEEACRQVNPYPDRLTIEVTATPLPPLPAVVEVAAYRIATESVTNLVRHAGARHATVRFTVDGTSSYLRLEVIDDGAGIAPDARPGAGLRSMRERADEIGGELAVVPRLPRGTTVRAVLPLTVGAYDGKR